MFQSITNWVNSRPVLEKILAVILGAVLIFLFAIGVIADWFGAGAGIESIVSNNDAPNPTACPIASVQLEAGDEFVIGQAINLEATIAKPPANVAVNFKWATRLGDFLNGEVTSSPNNTYVALQEGFDSISVNLIVEKDGQEIVSCRDVKAIQTVTNIPDTIIAKAPDKSILQNTPVQTATISISMESPTDTPITPTETKPHISVHPLASQWNTQQGSWVTHNEDPSLPMTLAEGASLNHDDFSLYEFRLATRVDATELSFCTWDVAYTGSSNSVSLGVSMVNGDGWIWYRQLPDLIIDNTTTKFRLDFTTNSWKEGDSTDSIAGMDKVNGIGFWVNGSLGVSTGTLTLTNMICG